MPHTELLAAIDVGTTTAKAVVFDAQARPRGAGERGYPVRGPGLGEAEQDPAQVIEAALGAARAAVAQAGAGEIAGVSLCTAMHALVGLDRGGAPVTPLLTWADTRAASQAALLRAEHPELHARTGTPPHAMAPLAKLMWFAHERPDLHARVTRWVGLKELLVRRLTGEWLTDVSCASGTGLMDSASGAWDPVALELAQIDAQRLAPIVPVTHRLALTATELGLAAGTPVVIGGGDGPLANLGLGAVAPGMAACSIGTSGALRLTVPAPGVDPAGELFCYALLPDRWILGGATSNGGSVLAWLGATLAPELGEDGSEALLRLAARAPAGSEDLIMLPYLLGERAPHWSSLARGAFVGLRHSHGREHMIRAGIEGVCQQLALVLGSLTTAGHAVGELRATGGFARSRWWRQLLADVLGIEIGYSTGPQGSALGAALIGRLALGHIDSVAQAGELVRVAARHVPNPDAAAVYAELRPVFAALYDDLAPAFRALAATQP